MPSGLQPVIADLQQPRMVFLWTVMTDSSFLLQPCWSQAPRCNRKEHIAQQDAKCVPLDDSAVRLSCMSWLLSLVLPFTIVVEKSGSVNWLGQF